MKENEDDTRLSPGDLGEIGKSEILTEATILSLSCNCVLLHFLPNPVKLPGLMNVERFAAGFKVVDSCHDFSEVPL